LAFLLLGVLDGRGTCGIFAARSTPIMQRKFINQAILTATSRLRRWLLRLCGDVH